MSLAILTIGTELTRGELNDTNGGWLADALTALGHEVTEIVSIDDDDARIVETLTRLSKNHQAIISTGGLGPTTDDRTTACVARAMGVSLLRDNASLESISQLYLAHGRKMSPSNEKQADFPQGAMIFPNSRGTAPGFSCLLGKARLFVLPGVPAEMRPLFRDSVKTLLPQNHTAHSCIRLRCFGIPEAEVGERLDGIEADLEVTLGYRASNSEIEIKVLSSGQDETRVQSQAEHAAQFIEERLGACIYTRGSGSLPQIVGELLSEQHLTLGLAESCTGGLTSQLITENPGASAYYKGGICSYSNAVKSSILGVEDQLLNRHGAVSEPVAIAMAQGAKRSLDVDFALAITGVAGPGGGTEEKPVGLVHFAITTPTTNISECRVFRGNRKRVQRRAADHGLWMLRAALLS